MPEPLLRRARPEDADAVVPLLVEAMDALALELAGAATACEAWPAFRELFAARGNRYGHEHVRVLDEDGVVVAAILAYPGRHGPRLAPPAGERARRVLPRRTGGGAVAARPRSCRVDDRRPAAMRAPACWWTRPSPAVKRLYQRPGFAADGQRHEHMVKPLR